MTVWAAAVMVGMAMALPDFTNLHVGGAAPDHEPAAGRRPFAWHGRSLRLLLGAWAAVFDVLVPLRCALCSTHDRRPVCSRCTRALEHLPLLRTAGPAGMTTLFALGPYEGALRLAVLNLKFRNCRPAARVLGRILGAKLPGLPWVVVPVPLHAHRLRERGYNQAEAIAQGIVDARRESGSSLACVLERPRFTEAQSSLPLRRRSANVRGAFAVQGGVGLGATAPVLLVDDVVTTGNTLAACTQALLAAGARAVAAAALAMTL